MIPLTITVADLTREFVELNRHVKQGTATEAQATRWQELRSILVAAQQVPPPRSSAPGPSTTR